MKLRVRPVVETDTDEVMALAPRLETGVAAWHDPAGVARAARNWVESSLAGRDDDDRACFVAEDEDRVLGFVSVTSKDHWSGATHAYIGELIVSESAERLGVGRALVETAADWARSRGFERIALDTGAANAVALAFYEAMRFEPDEVRLSRRLR